MDLCELTENECIGGVVVELVNVWERWSHNRVDRGDAGSIPPAAVSQLRQFRSPRIACVFWKKLVVPSVWCLCQGK